MLILASFVLHHKKLYVQFCIDHMIILDGRVGEGVGDGGWEGGGICVIYVLMLCQNRY